MTDKERLKKIKEIDISPLCFYLNEMTNFDGKLLKGYWKWLIKQVERVEELEKDLLELVKQNKELRKSITFYSSESYNAHLERLLDRSEKQIKRYREALEFYANQKHVRFKFYGNSEGDIIVDYGETARKALEGEE